MDYQQLFEEMPCYLSIQDRDYRIVAANRRFRDDFGDRLGEPCHAVYKGLDEVCPGCPVAQTFEDGASHSSEQQLTTRDGRSVPVMVHTRPIAGADGHIESVLEMHTDITESKALQTRLRESRGRLTALFEQVPCYLAVIDREMRIQHANRVFRDAFGPSVGEPCYRVYKHRDEPCLVCPALQTFQDGEVREHEEVVTSVDGERINVLCTTAPIRGADGKVESVIEMATDITQMRQLQSQLTSIGLMVGSISHGIKGLLTGLDGGIYLVNSGFAKDKPERVDKGWLMVQRNVDRIRSMVLDILYYAKDRELEIEEIDAAVLADDLRGNLEKKAGDLDIEFRMEIAPGAGLFQGDTRAIRAMLVNLLENSLEACHVDRRQAEHNVRFSVRREEPWMVFEVEDDGIGMDRETREKVFSLFFSSKGIKGTGLGLFISNKIVDKHGGSIDVTSEPGQGALFVVRLPLIARPSTRPEDMLG